MKRFSITNCSTIKIIISIIVISIAIGFWNYNNLYAQDIEFSTQQAIDKTWGTKLYIMNPNDGEANVTVSFYDTDGNLIATEIFTLNGFGSIEVEANQISSLSDGFYGSAQVEADQPLAMHVGVQAIDEEIGTARYTGITEGVNKVFVPSLACNDRDQKSDLMVMNSGANEATTTITYYRADEDAQISKNHAIASNGTLYLDICDEVNESGWVGGAVIEGNENDLLAATVFQPYITGNSVVAYEGYNGQGYEMADYMLAFQGIYRIVTTFNIQNISEAEAQIIFKIEDSTIEIGRVTKSIKPNQIVQLEGKDVGMNEGNAGSASVEVTNGQKIIVTENSQSSDKNCDASGMLIASGSNDDLDRHKLVIPGLFFKEANTSKKVMNVSIRNVGETASNVTTTFYNSAGEVHNVVQQTIYANGAEFFSLDNSTSEVISSAIIEGSDINDQLIVQVNEIIDNCSAGYGSGIAELSQTLLAPIFVKSWASQANFDIPISGLSMSHKDNVVLNTPVHFETNLTTGNNVTYQWNFGDNSPVISTTATTLNHTYFQAGTYTIVLTASNRSNRVTINSGLVVSPEPTTTPTYTPQPTATPQPPTATPQPLKQNVDLAGQYDVDGTIIGMVKNYPYLYIGVAFSWEEDKNNYLAVLDISDPTQPIEVGRWESLNGDILDTNTSDLAINGDHLYIAQIHGLLTIINIANPTAPEWVGEYADYGDYFSKMIAQDNYVYVTAGNFSVYDVSDPTTPKSISSYDEPSLIGGSIALYQNYVYLTHMNDGLRILDVATPNNPQPVGFCCDNAEYIWGFKQLFINNNQLYVLERLLGSDKYGIEIFDISAPLTPVFLGHYVFFDNLISESDSDFVFKANNRFLYLQNSNGLEIITIENPSLPLKVGYYNIPLLIEDDITIGYLDIQDNYIYITDSDKSSIFILQFNEPDELPTLTPTPSPTSTPTPTPTTTLIPSQPETVTVGPEGVSIPLGRIELTIPQSSSRPTMNVTYQDEWNPQTTEKQQIFAFYLTALDISTQQPITQFDEPVTIQVLYSSGIGKNLSSIKPYWFNGTEWVTDGLIVTDYSTSGSWSTVTFETQHFTLFALLGEPLPRIYLPMLTAEEIKQSNRMPPTISNFKYEWVTINDKENCPLVQGKYGSELELSFDYTDPDGIRLYQVIIYNKAIFSPSGNSYINIWDDGIYTVIENDEFNGTLSFYPCSKFDDDQAIDMSITLDDGYGNISNKLQIRVPRPVGANSTD